MSDMASSRVPAPSSLVSPVFLEPVMGPEPEPEVEPAAATAEPEVEPAATIAEPAAPVVLAPLLELRDGVGPVIDDAAALRDAVARLATGTGPLAVDAERASSYRYGHRAYLVQLRREGTGILLIDPISCPDLSAIGTAVSDVEWIVHAAVSYTHLRAH